MKHLSNLFSGKLTAYQIATATDVDIHIIEELMENANAADELDDSSFNKLVQLENELFTPSVNKNETSA
ncbi:hypothetical protein ERX27_02125 [Macrococcus brunensis]|uniref:Uncharacterized protein n=1 Tax=Macrococcus brunensis TaxID=198483 RepID=A0A4R6BFH6_9STAP|nr:hypothetical protein [Macrococcus brunensis]TDL98594.1 hypothetical protein ERX27_02125 [Macrococcus brunensis]ULG73635.1 hypothetical protein MGG13_07985 [Macrococcus brunensis]